MILERLEPPTTKERAGLPLETAIARLRRWKMVREQPWPGFGEPFNGQAVRTRTVDLLIETFEPASIIETGTFLGFTARKLASYGPPVFTVELSPRVRTTAASSLADLDNVTMIWGDSAQAVKRIGEAGKAERPFAYLDAHWEEAVPLSDEVAALSSYWDEALIVIDDFHVPQQPGYGYDVYRGVPISLDELVVPDGMTVAFPAVRATEETGARRGTAYLAKGEPARHALEAAQGAGLLTIQS